MFLNRVVNVYLFKILMFCANAARTLQRKENYFMVCNSVEESYNLRDIYEQLLQQNVYVTILINLINFKKYAYLGLQFLK